MCAIPGNKGIFAEIGVEVSGAGLCGVPVNRGRLAETGV